jgi:hypothetical protein
MFLGQAIYVIGPLQLGRLAAGGFGLIEPDTIRIPPDPLPVAQGLGQPESAANPSPAYSRPNNRGRW